MIEEPLAEEFAKVRAEAYAACKAKCEKIANERYERHQAALLSIIQIEHPEIVKLPEHFRGVATEGMDAAEECARAIAALGGLA